MSAGDLPDEPAAAALAANLRVYTFKRGLLAVAGHDLCLRLDDFELRLEGGAVSGRFLLSSVRVVGSVRRGVVDEHEPGASDRRSIEEAIAREVLDVARHPRADFAGTLERRPGGVEARGELLLHGARRPITALCPWPPSASMARFELELPPSRWGIAPYQALGGALKLEDRLRVMLELELDDALRADPLSARARWAPPRRP